jgi:hypothetical protein
MGHFGLFLFWTKHDKLQLPSMSTDKEVLINYEKHSNTTDLLFFLLLEMMLHTGAAYAVIVILMMKKITIQNTTDFMVKK